jgi:hypothetical protein
VAVRVERHGADRAVLGVALPLAIGHEPAGILELEAGVLGVAHGALADQQHVRRLLEDRARQRHGMAHTGHAGASAGLLARPVHHGRVHLDVALRVQHRATARVEERAVLERPHRGLGRVKRRGTTGEQLVAREQGVAERAVHRRLVVDLAAQRIARAPVDQQDGCDVVHSGRWCHGRRGR